VRRLCLTLALTVSLNNNAIRERGRD
jgi:hypothetical protein